MARAYLVGALGLPFAPVTEATDVLVAVDEGFRHLRSFGLVPDLSIGDFDSLGHVPSIGEVEVHPPAKDEIDLELALNWACAHDFTEIALFGCLGGRLDFSLACLQLMARTASQGIKIVAWDERGWVVTLAAAGLSSLSFSGEAEGRFSLLAASSFVEGLTESGVAYEVDHARLTAHTPYGISNRFIGRPASLSLKEGIAHLFLPSAALAQASDPWLVALGRQGQ